jgi:sensor histidine kinase YesM
MTEVFNSMKSGIARYVDAIKDKAEMESSLMEQRVKNLEVTNLLRHAELSSLQSRINPHFLFNTLNAGVQLATLEEADRTRVFLENLTAMLRYSIRELNAPATLADEFASIESYLYLIDIRFPGRIRAEIKLEPEAAAASIPKMTIQPLVENAILHGFTDDVPNPLLGLEARREGEDILVTVEDNGVGFMPGRPEAIMAAAEDEEALALKPGPGEKDGESMGLVNVIRRLRLYTGREDALVIDDTKRIGSRIVIRIPEARRSGT